MSSWNTRIAELEHRKPLAAKTSLRLKWRSHEILRESRESHARVTVKCAGYKACPLAIYLESRPSHARVTRESRESHARVRRNNIDDFDRFGEFRIRISSGIQGVTASDFLQNNQIRSSQAAAQRQRLVELYCFFSWRCLAVSLISKLIAIFATSVHEFAGNEHC